jgi:hypothetical protein
MHTCVHTPVSVVRMTRLYELFTSKFMSARLRRTAPVAGTTSNTALAVGKLYVNVAASPASTSDPCSVA